MVWISFFSFSCFFFVYFSFSFSFYLFFCFCNCLYVSDVGFITATLQISMIAMEKYPSLDNVCSSSYISLHNALKNVVYITSSIFCFNFLPQRASFPIGTPPKGNKILSPAALRKIFQLN